MVQKTGNIKDIKRYLVPHYFGCLTKFAKAIGHNELTAEDIIFARDCPREKIWRNKFYQDYKANRSYQQHNDDPL